MAPHGKELFVDLKRRIVVLHEDGKGNIRVGSTQNRPRVGYPKKLSARAERHIQMLSLKDQCRSAVSIAAEIEEVGG